VAGTIVVGEEARRRREERRLLERLDVPEVHVAPRTAEAPRRRVIRKLPVPPWCRWRG
jgi:hypothetical protein